jgi:cation transport ATPase
MQQDITLTITGMTCASCVQSVEHLALKVEGVEHAAVNLPMARGRFTIEGEANDSIAEAFKLVDLRLSKTSFLRSKWKLNDAN